VKKIIKYKIFKTSETFEQFQNLNNIGISSISPIPTKIECNVSGLDLECAVFVTYFDEISNRHKIG